MDVGQGAGRAKTTPEAFGLRVARLSFEGRVQGVDSDIASEVFPGYIARLS